jgi:hypothetical protein
MEVLCPLKNATCLDRWAEVMSLYKDFIWEVMHLFKFNHHPEIMEAVQSNFTELQFNSPPQFNTLDLPMICFHMLQ